MTFTILDPTDERVPVRRNLSSRNGRLEGSIALLDISKPRGDVLLARVEARLREAYPNLAIRRYRKPTFAKPAPETLRREILADNDFVIEALAD